MKDVFKEDKKEREKMKKTAIISRLIPYLMEHKFLFAVCILLTLGGNLLGLAGPYFSGFAIDAIEFGEGHVDLSGVWKYAGAMAAVYV